MDLIVLAFPIFLIMLFLPKFLLILLAKGISNALFRDKIIDKDLRNSLYRNGVFADFIAVFVILLISFIQTVIENPDNFIHLSDYLNYFGMSFSGFVMMPIYYSQDAFNNSIIIVLIVVAVSALLSLFFDYFTVFRNPDLSKKQKICTLIIFVLMTAPYYFLLSPSMF